MRVCVCSACESKVCNSKCERCHSGQSVPVSVPVLLCECVVRYAGRRTYRRVCGLCAVISVLVSELCEQVRRAVQWGQ